MRIKPVALALSLALLAPLVAACSDFDMDKLDVFHLNEKKKLPGVRQELFPGGVPGVSNGVPPELVKGYQAPPLESASAETEPPKTKAEPAKPKPHVAKRTPAKPKAAPAQQPAQAPQPQQAQDTAWPAPQQQQSAQQAPWPSSPPQQQQTGANAPWPSAPQQPSAWPTAPAPGTFQKQ